MNFFSNSSIFNMSLENLENVVSQKILEKLSLINLQKSQGGDPLIKLLEDIKTRKIKVVIPSQEDTIPYLTNDNSIKKSVRVDISIKKNNLKLEKPVRFPQIFKNQRSPNFPTLEQKIVLQKLKKIPVYVVVTNKNEMVMAMSRDHAENNLLSWISKKYHNAFVWTEDEGPISLGLFFMNKEDAQLYLHEIVNSNPKMAERSEIEIKMVGLDTFYKINRTAPPGQQAKLIADLKEIENVIKDYIPKKGYSTNSKQKYSKSSYQGNPIYIIRPTLAINKKNKLEVIDYDIKNFTSRKYIFFKLKDANSAWDKFCDDHKDLQLPLYPNVEIYNLENYLIDLEQSKPNVIKDISFVSPEDSFQNLKLENAIQLNKSSTSLVKDIKRLVSEKFKNFKAFSKKILWVLTSDTLPTEKNAW